MISVEKSPLLVFMFSPRNKIVASSDGVASSNVIMPVTENDVGFLKVGSGECLP